MHIYEVKRFLCKLQGCESAHGNHGFIDQRNLDFHMASVHGNSSSQPSNKSNSPSPSDSSLQYSHKSPANSQKDGDTSSLRPSDGDRTLAVASDETKVKELRVKPGLSNPIRRASSSHISNLDDMQRKDPLGMRTWELLDPISDQDWIEPVFKVESEIRANSKDGNSSSPPPSKTNASAIGLFKEGRPFPRHLRRVSALSTSPDVAQKKSKLAKLAPVAAEKREFGRKGKLKDWEDLRTLQRTNLGPDPVSQEESLPFDGKSITWKRVHRGLRKEKTLRGSLAMDWDLLGFIKHQYSDVENVDLGSVITLSGTVLHAQATTCSEYARKTWPSQGPMVIAAFQSAIDSREHTCKGSSTPPCHLKNSILCILTFASLDTQSKYRHKN